MKVPPRRWVTLVFAALCAGLGYSLVLGKGGWVRLHVIEGQLQTQRTANRALEKQNQSLSAEVDDLKSGTDALEERSRSTLGLVRPDETYYRLLPPGTAVTTGVSTEKTTPK